MFTLNLKCINCDYEGVPEIPGYFYELPASRIFKYFGHNPLSGHLHYQCPHCNIVLLVDPQDVLGDGFVINVRENSESVGSLRTYCNRVSTQ